MLNNLIFLILFSAQSAKATLKLDSVIQKIQSYSCAAALLGQQKPLLIVTGLGNFGYE